LSLKAEEAHKYFIVPMAAGQKLHRTAGDDDKTTCPLP